MNRSLEPMLPGHWPAVSEIYAEGLATGNATFETQVPEWERWDKAHMAQGRFVAIQDGQVVGWAALKRVTRKAFGEGVAEVSVYVTSSERGTGIGKALLERLVTESEELGIWTLQASVFPENIATIRLHEHAGFRQVGRREHIAQLRGVWRDTLLLERRSDRVGPPPASAH